MVLMPLPMLAAILFWSVGVIALAALAAAAWCWGAGTWEWAPRAFLSRNGLALLWAAALVGAVVFVSPPRMRVQLDETELVSASYSMHEAAVDRIVLELAPDGRGGAAVFNSSLARRPPLFAWLANLLHLARGPSVENALIVNAVALFALLALIGTALGAGTVVRLSAQTLVASTPAVILAATSTGFELVALVLLVALTLAARACLARPVASRVAWVFAVAALFSYARYESFLIALAVIAALGVGLRRAGRPWPRAAWLCLIAYCAALVPMLALFASTSPLAVRAFGGSEAALALDSAGHPFVDPLGALARAGLTLARFCDPRPGPVFFGAADLAWLVALALMLKSKRRLSGETLVTAVACGAPMLITLLWWGGNPDDLNSGRLFLVFAVVGALGPLVLYDLLRKRLEGRRSKTIGKAVGCAAVLVAACGLQLAGFVGERERYLPPGARIADQLDALLERHPPTARTLYVTRYAPYLALRGTLGLYPASATAGLSTLRRLVATHALGEVILVETSLDAFMTPDPGEIRRFKAGVRLTPLDIERDAHSGVALWRVSL